MDERARKRAPKWVQAVKTVDWLTAQMPPKSEFQIYAFNNEVKPLIPDSKGQWLKIDNGKKLKLALDTLGGLSPKGGTNLYAAFQAMAELKPKPDNVYLLVDGLPTQGQERSRSKLISGEERLRLFNKAVNIVPLQVPINIIMFPMEGDPKAASNYWELSQNTFGSFIYMLA